MTARTIGAINDVLQFAAFGFFQQPAQHFDGIGIDFG
jgi:hypothetical protein